MAAFKINNYSLLATDTKEVSPSIKIQKGTSIQYCPLFEGTSTDPFIWGKDQIVSRLPIKVTSPTGIVYCPIKLEEVLNLSPTLTLYYKAVMAQNMESGSEQRRSCSYGSYGSSSCSYYTYTGYRVRRYTYSYLKLNGAVSTTNTNAKVVITSANCNNVNILNTYGSIQYRESYNGILYDNTNQADAYGPAYATFNETHAVAVAYQIRLGNIVVKSGTVNIAINVPINSGSERSVTLTLGL